MKKLFLLSIFIIHQLHAQVDHWETVVFENDLWEYTVPTSSVNPSWNQLGFNASGWSSGNGGFGYGDGDDNTTIPSGSISCYQRIEFTITDTSVIDLAALTIDYDDGFVAYLNGVEITRDLVANTPPQWNETASGLHEAEIYQGIYPYQYTITKDFLSNNLNEGLNVLAVETHNQSATSSDMTSRVYLHLGISNSGNYYTPVPVWFVPPVVLTTSNLPIIVIDTENDVSIPDEPKVNAVMGIIHNGTGQMNSISDPFNEFYGEIGIEIRGSSSQIFPKKGYAVETRKPNGLNYNASIFNWPADNDWVLYAPYSDKSLIRNVLTYEIGRKMGRYAPRTKLCEVVINGEYQGVYVFTEKIKQGNGKVNIDKLNYADTIDQELSGGYIVKIDKTTGGGVIAWTSPFTAAPPATGPINYQLHDPSIDTIHPSQSAYIESYITDFEVALSSVNFTDPVTGYRPYIDLMSFVDFMIVNEISKNVDGYRISTFYHKRHIKNGGELVAGPLWDFNLAWGNANYCEGGLTTGWEIYFNDVCGGGGSLNNPFHWNRMVQDPTFTHALNCRWQELRQGILHTDSVHAFIDDKQNYLTDAANRNFTKWPVLGNNVWPNNFVGNTYQEEIDYLKNWATDRLNWLDNNMFGSCTDLSVDKKESLDVLVYPNPTKNKIFVQSNTSMDEFKIRLYNSRGQEIREEKCASNQYEMDVSHVLSGIYFLEIIQDNNIIKHEKIIIR